MMEEDGHAPSWVSKPKQKRRALATATERISQRLLRRGATDVCPGFAAKGLWNRVFLPVFELPDEGYLGYLRGRTANVSPKSLGLESMLRLSVSHCKIGAVACPALVILSLSTGHFSRRELERCAS